MHGRGSQRRPLLLLLKGHPGSGKSTLAHALAGTLQWPLVDKDDARDAVQALAAQIGPPQLNGLSYDVMWRVAGRQLACGNSVIVDSPLARRELYDAACALASQFNAVVAVIECATSDERVWRARLESRAAEDGAAQRPQHKPATWDQLQQLLAGYERCYEWPASLAPAHYLLLDSSSAAPHELTERVLHFLAAQGLRGPNATACFDSSAAL